MFLNPYRFSSLPENDPFFDNVSLLLHGESITDSSKWNHSLTNAGVVATPAQSKYGGGSLFFDGSSYLIAPEHISFDLGTDSFTIEAWLRPTGTGPAFSGIVSSNTTSETNYFYLDGPTNGVGVGGTLIVDFSNTGVITNNVWQHVALVRNADVSSMTIYVNGVAVAADLEVHQFMSCNWGIGGLVVGQANAGFGIVPPSHPQQAYIGYMDELRITQGIARYTGNFTPPSKVAPSIGPEPGLPAPYPMLLAPSFTNTTPTSGAVFGVGGGSAVPGAITYGPSANSISFGPQNVNGALSAVWNVGTWPATWTGNLVLRLSVTNIATELYTMFWVSMENPYAAISSNIAVNIRGNDGMLDIGEMASIMVTNNKNESTSVISTTTGVVTVSAQIELVISPTTAVLSINGTPILTHTGAIAATSVPPDTPGNPTLTGFAGVTFVSGGTTHGNSKACTLTEVAVYCTGGDLTPIPYPP